MKRKPPQPQPTSKYKSKFEAEFANNLTKKKIVFTYEPQPWDERNAKYSSSI